MVVVVGIPEAAEGSPTFAWGIPVAAEAGRNQAATLAAPITVEASHSPWAVALAVRSPSVAAWAMRSP